MTEIRTCYICKQLKPRDDFRSDAQKRSDTCPGGVCKKCSCELSRASRRRNLSKRLQYEREYEKRRDKSHRRERMRAWRKNNPEIVAAQKRRSAYGVSKEQFEIMLLAQNNCCALCGETFQKGKKREVYLDHDHNTGKVRGLLHQNCNAGIGCFGEDTQKLGKAIAYILKHK